MAKTMDTARSEIAPYPLSDFLLPAFLSSRFDSPSMNKRPTQVPHKQGLGAGAKHRGYAYSRAYRPRSSPSGGPVGRTPHESNGHRHRLRTRNSSSPRKSLQLPRAVFPLHHEETILSSLSPTEPRLVKQDGSRRSENSHRAAPPNVDPRVDGCDDSARKFQQGRCATIHPSFGM